MFLNDYEFTAHAIDVIRERKILESWISDALNNPDWNTVKEDGNSHSDFICVSILLFIP